MAATGDLHSVLTQHSPAGLTSQKAAVATYLLDRGIDVPPDNVVLTADPSTASTSRYAC